MRIVRLILVGLLATCWISCGYKVGFLPSTTLKGVKKIHVPVSHNMTYHPTVGTIVTEAVIQRIMRDGTLSVVGPKEADVVLEIKLTDISRDPLRQTLADVRRTVEYAVRIHADYTVTRTSDGSVILSRQDVVGSADYFVGQDQTEAERQALGLAANKLAETIVTEIVESW